MRCGRCNSKNLSVIDSRAEGENIRRRRECNDCSFRFSTIERVELSLPMVIKKDGRREPFVREKVQAGLVRACEKRPVSMEEITKVLESIEFKLHEMGIKEIQSRDIGEFVMDALKELDHVAYVRFASVYREFSDINQFAEALKLLKSSSR